MSAITLKKSKEKNMIRIILEVASSNHASKALYKKENFTKIGIRKNYYSSVNSKTSPIDA